MRLWIHLGYFIPDLDRPYTDMMEETLEIVKAAERLGFEGVTIPEDNFSNTIVNPSALEQIAYFAGQTSTLKFRTGVLVLPYHHPLKLAGEIAMIDHLTQGRLEIGVARGAGPRQSVRFGIDPKDMRGMYEEALPLLNRAWTEYDFTHEGEFWNFPEVTVLPRPYQPNGPKMWIAAMSGEGLKRAGQQGLNLMTGSNAPTFFSPFDELEQAIGIYDEGLAESGATRGDVSITRWCWVDETDEAAFRRLPEAYFHWRNYATGGPAAAHKTTEQLFLPRDDKKSGWERLERPVIKGWVDYNSVPAEVPDVPDKRDGALIMGVDKAIETFQHFHDVGVTDLNLAMQWGAPLEEVVRSMEMIMDKVVPSLPFVENTRPQVTVS